MSTTSCQTSPLRSGHVASHVERAELNLLSWNILAQRWADLCFDEGEYPLASAGDMAWETRAPRILAELEASGADVIVLQEVGKREFDELLMPRLSAAGYQGLHKKDGPRPHPTNATFWKASRLRLESAKHHGRVLVTVLHDCQNGASVAVVNVHLEGDPQASLKRVQQLESALRGAASAGAPHASLVVAGDFNATAESSAAAYLAFGSVPPGTREAWGGAKSCEVPAEVLSVPAHAYQLESAYGVDCDARAFSFAPTGRRGWYGMLDHIWHDTRALRCVARRPLFASEAAREDLLRLGMPSAAAPSDHLPCGVTFRWTEGAAAVAPVGALRTRGQAPDPSSPVDAPTVEHLLGQAAELLAGCPFASEAQRADWEWATEAPSACKGKPTADELAVLARQRRRKEELLGEVPHDARDVLTRVLQLQKEAKKLAKLQQVAQARPKAQKEAEPEAKPDVR